MNPVFHDKEATMKKMITKAIHCLLLFWIMLGVTVSNATATIIPTIIPRIVGYLDKRMVQRIVRLHENEIRYCYETALRKDKTLQGMMVTTFVILRDGSVEKALIKESTINNHEVEQCVIDHIEEWKFYAVSTNNSAISDIETIVEYPFVFVSNYKPPTILEHIRLILDPDDMKVEYYDTPLSPEDISEIMNGGERDEQ